MENKMESSDYEYVGFWARVVASLLDTVLFTLIFIPVLLSVYGWNYFSTGFQVSGPIDFLITWIVPPAVIIGCWTKWQFTPGKHAIGAIIVDAKTGDKPSTKEYLIRYAGYFVSMIPLFLGIIWVGIDRKKRGWHDLLAGTVVIRKRHSPHCK
jgi:uncharacterized RDD family membrane protein YckC